MAAKKKKETPAPAKETDAPAVSNNPEDAPKTSTATMPAWVR